MTAERRKSDIVTKFKKVQSKTYPSLFRALVAPMLISNMFLITMLSFFNFSFFSHFKNCYSITVVPIFPPLPSFAPPTPLLPQSIPTLLSTSVGHSYMFFVEALPLLPTIVLLLPPLWSLSVCSIFPHL